MKMKFYMIAAFMALTMSLSAQTYVDEMTEATTSVDAMINGSIQFEDFHLKAPEGDVDKDRFGDATYAYRATDNEDVSIWYSNYDGPAILDGKTFTGLRINLLWKDMPTKESLAKMFRLEYSTNEGKSWTKLEDFNLDFIYDSDKGENGYWKDLYIQGALPANVGDVKLTLLGGETNWVISIRRVEIFYTGGTAYSYQKPEGAYVEPISVSDFNFDFESAKEVISLGGENLNSSSVVVANAHKYGMNKSENVLKITHAPLDSSNPEDEWGWGNGDWFGTYVALPSDQLKISAEMPYLHVMVYREAVGPSVVKIEGVTDQEATLETAGEWVDMVFDLTGDIGKIAEKLYFSPNRQFETLGTTVAEVTYIDNIRMSASATPEINKGETETSIEYVTKDKASFHITVHGGNMIVSGVAGKLLQVFSTDGKCIYSFEQFGDIAEVPVNRGIFIVKVGDLSQKVLVNY